MKAYKPNTIKKHNLNILREILQQGKSYSTKELTEMIDLSVVSINKLLGELKQIGEIFVDQKAAVTGGKRAAVYRYNPNFRQMLILQFVEHNQEMFGELLVYNLFEEVVAQWTLSSAELTIDPLKDRIRQVILAYPSIQLLVFGIPGEELDGRLQIMDFEPLCNTGFRAIMLETFQLDIIIENDINAAALCQALIEPRKEICMSIYYPENYPPGAGIVIDGKIFHGKHGLSGEIKHLPIDNQYEFPRNTEL